MVEINVTEEKASKIKAIETTLQEMGMTRQELVDLITSLFSQSVSEERVEEVSQDMSGLSIDQMALLIAEGNTEEVAKYLSLEEMEKLKIKLGLSYNIKRMAELGLAIDMDKVSAMLEIQNVTQILANNIAVAQGRQHAIAPDKALKINAELETRISSAIARGLSPAVESGRSTDNGQSNNNNNSQTTKISRFIGNIMSQAQNITASVSGIVATASTSIQQQQQQMQIQNTVRTVERAVQNMRRHERNMKKMFPEIGKVSAKGGSVFATVKGKDGQVREVNLKDYLREGGRLTDKAVKLIDSMTDTASAIEVGLQEISRGLPKVKSFNFDAAGRMQVQFETEKDLKKVNIADYISDLARDQQRAEAAAQNKKGEIERKQSAIESKLATAENNSSAVREKAISKGPELDGSNTLHSTEQLRDPSLKYMTQQVSATEAEPEKKPKELQEAGRMKNELVKLDAMSDRLKLQGDLESAKSAMKDVMKDMKEAEQNKGLVDEMKKQLQREKEKGL